LNILKRGYKKIRGFY